MSEKKKQYSSKEIVEILHSFTKFELDSEKDLDIWQVGGAESGSGKRSFVYGSFTSELLELIHYHMLAPEDRKDEEDQDDE